MTPSRRRDRRYTAASAPTRRQRGVIAATVVSAKAVAGAPVRGENTAGGCVGVARTSACASTGAHVVGGRGDKEGGGSWGNGGWAKQTTLPICRLLG